MQQKWEKVFTTVQRNGVFSHLTHLNMNFQMCYYSNMFPYILLDEILGKALLILLVVFIILPGIVMPISIILGYRYTHSEKYIKEHKEEIEANRRRREQEEREYLERINRQTENVATGGRIGGRSQIERMGAKGEISINNILMREVTNKGW